MSREVGVDRTWHGRGVRKEGSEGLKYHRRTSHGQRCVEACYITRELVMDKGVWKLAIHVLEPWVGREIWWVSPLAYPNLSGTKGFIIIIIIVVITYFFNFIYVPEMILIPWCYIHLNKWLCASRDVEAWVFLLFKYLESRWPPHYKSYSFLFLCILNLVIVRPNL